MTYFYTGVGSRNAPSDILSFMVKLSEFYKNHYTLRSGGAKGSDVSFEKGAGTNKVIYEGEYYKRCQPELFDKALAIASSFHGGWGFCSDYAKKLHARNAFQVLGDDLKTPSSFLVCWTPDSCVSHTTRSRETGGTGTAISIAWDYGIPIYNLAIQEHLDLFKNYITF